MKIAAISIGVIAVIFFIWWIWKKYSKPECTCGQTTDANGVLIPPTNPPLKILI